VNSQQRLTGVQVDIVLIQPMQCRTARTANETCAARFLQRRAAEAGVATLSHKLDNRMYGLGLHTHNMPCQDSTQARFAVWMKWRDKRGGKRLHPG